MVNPNFPDIPVSDQRGFIYSDARIRALLGGNRAMKTESGSIDVLWYGLGKHPVRSKLRQPPVHGRICAPKYEDGCKGVILKKFRSMIPHHELSGSSWQRAWSEKSKMLKLANGSTYNYKSYEQDINTYGGDDLDFFWMDEHGEWKYMRENMARIVDRGGYGILTMTPEAGQTWEEDFLKNPPEGITTAYWFFDTRGNPFISKEGIETFMATLSDKKYFEAKIEGKFVALAGLVYPTFEASKALVKDFDIPRHWERHILIDPHLRKFTALMWTAWSPDGDHIIYRTRKVKMPIPELAKYIRAQSINDPEYALWIGDEAMGGDGLNIFGEKSVLEQLNGLGLPFIGTNQVSDKTFKAGVESVAAELVPDHISGNCKLKIFESCVEGPFEIEGYKTGDIIWEFNRYRFKKEQKSDEETFREKVATVDDDYLDLLRYDTMAGAVNAGGGVRIINSGRVDPVTGC